MLLVAGLTGDEFGKALPLHAALTEVENTLLAKGAHPNHGPSTLTVVTDGQLPLRMVLHAEAAKNR